jgi:hypothetical protein
MHQHLLPRCTFRSSLDQQIHLVDRSRKYRKSKHPSFFSLQEGTHNQFHNTANFPSIFQHTQHAINICALHSVTPPSQLAKSAVLGRKDERGCAHGRGCMALSGSQGKSRLARNVSRFTVSIFVGFKQWAKRVLVYRAW